MLLWGAKQWCGALSCLKELKGVYLNSEECRHIYLPINLQDCRQKTIVWLPYAVHCIWRG